MKFTLLFYTDDWDVGPVVELEHVPQPGSVVWVKGKKRDDEGQMYYVDNLMYPEKGLDKEDVVYLYVRPYEGYAEYAPRTETDRLAEKLDTIARELRALKGEVAETNLRAAAMGESLASLETSVREKQQEISDLVDEAVSTLGQIKETMYDR